MIEGAWKPSLPPSSASWGRGVQPTRRVNGSPTTLLRSASRTLLPPRLGMAGVSEIP